LGNASVGGWSHAVVAYGIVSALGYADPAVNVAILLSNPNIPQSRQVATYNLVSHTFSCIEPVAGGNSYDTFYVIEPISMLPTNSWTKNWNPTTGIWWDKYFWLNCSTYWYNIVISDTNVVITSKNLQDYFTSTGDSRTFVEGIQGSCGIEEQDFQVYAIPNDTAFNVIDPSSEQSSIFIARVENESGQPVGYGYILDTTTVQGPLDYTLTPSESGMSISVGSSPLNASVTLISATLNSYSVFQALNVSLHVGETINFTVTDWQTLNSTAFQMVSVLPCKNVVGRGYGLPINVTIMNLSDSPQIYNVSVFKNSTVIGTETKLNIPNGTSATFAFTWNTTGSLYGNFSMGASVESVSYTTQGNCTCAVPVHVGVPGDVSSFAPGVYDGITNMRDVAYLVNLFDARPGLPNWTPNADVDGDGIVNMRDIAIAIHYFNQHE
jgi:hypothetical protein